MNKALFVLPLLTVLCASNSWAGATKEEAGNAITEAVVANNKVSAAGFEWRDTYKKLLKPAKEAYKKGDYDTAVKKAKTAKAHAELGLVQAEAGKNAGSMLK